MVLKNIPADNQLNAPPMIPDNDAMTQPITLPIKPSATGPATCWQG